MGRLFADRELYWDASRKVIVEENDRAQAFLCIHKGGEVTEEFLAKTKLKFDNGGRLVLPSKQVEPVVPVVKEKHWKDMNKAELSAYLEGLGVAVDGDMTKADLVKLAEELETN